MGTYTTRNAPEDGGEIVAVPIDVALYFEQYFSQYCRFSTRAMQYYKYIVICD
jgi:hypothetical protein